MVLGFCYRWSLSRSLGGEALDKGLESISPVFEFMIQYYVIIAIALVVIAVLGIAKSSDPAEKSKS